MHPPFPERFEFLEELASSPEEILARARDRTLLREVVLKIPGPDVAHRLRGHGDRSLALREARSLARIHDPGIARLLDVMETPEGILLVMEPVAGESLWDRLETEGPLPPAEVRRVALGLASALQAVHNAGVVHRGVSTQNVILRPDGTPCLVGFLFARFADASLGASTLVYRSSPSTIFQLRLDGAKRPHRIMPPHPAPELLSGQPGDARSDLFALGWVLHQCLTGTAPTFAGSGRKGRPLNPAKMTPGLPADLCRVVVRCLANNPLKRIPDASELLRLLPNVADPSATDAASSPGSPRGTLRRIAMVAGGLLLMALVGWQLAHQGSEAGAPHRGANARSVSDADDAEAFSDSYSGSHALLIGIGEVYGKVGHPPLPNAERDIHEIQSRLESMAWEQWEVQPLLGKDATRANIEEALHQLSGTAAPDDRVLIYFAGHGMGHEESGDSAWILPADAGPSNGKGARRNWIRFTEFEGFFSETVAKHVMVTLDCCHSGRLSSLRSASSEYRSKFLAEKAHVMLTSGRENERVLDGQPGQCSPFAQAFLDALSEDREALTSTQLFGLIHTQFLDRSLPQRPMLVRPQGDAGSGEFVFFLKDTGRRGSGGSP